MTYINHDETHRGDDRGDARVSLYDHDARKSRIRDINIMNARVLLYDHDARIEVTDTVYNKPRTAVEGTHRSRRRRTTADDDAPRPSALILRDATRTRDDRSIDRARRLDATRRDATRRESHTGKLAHSAVTTIADTRRIESSAPSATRRAATIAGNRATAKRSLTSPGPARAIDRDGTRGRARDGTRRDDDAARRRRETTGRDANDASDASDAKGASDERRWGS